MKEITNEERLKRLDDYRKIDPTKSSEAAKIATVRRILEGIADGSSRYIDEISFLRNMEFQIKMEVLQYKE